MNSRAKIILLILIPIILIWGLLAPNGIRAAIHNNAWSLAIVRNAANKTTPFVDIDLPPATHARAGLIMTLQALKNDDIDLALSTLAPLLNPNDRLVIETFAEICFLQGDYTKAILLWKLLGQYITLEQVPRVLSKEDNIDDVILAYKSANEIVPERYTISLLRIMRTQANQFIMENQYEQAIDVYLEMLSLFPEEGSVYIDLAWVYFLNDQPDLTEQTIEQGRYLSTEKASYYISTAYVYELMALPEKALEAYKLALEIDPFSTNAQKGIESLSVPNE